MMQATTAVSTRPVPLVNRPAVLGWEWLWLANALLLSLAVRIPFFRMPLLADEGGYAYATRGWVNGSGQLYDELWISRPQGIFFVYAGIMDLFGTDAIAFRFAAWIAVALTLIGVWGFARLATGPHTALLAATIFAIASASPNLEGFSANAEMFMGCPAAIGAWWLLHIGRCGWNRWELFGVGVLIGAAVSLKPSAAVMLPVAIIYVILMRATADRRAVLVRSAWLSAGVGIVGIGSLIHGWMLDWDDFVYATFTYRLTAQSAATVGLRYNLAAIARLAWEALPLLLLTGFALSLHYRHGAWQVLRSLLSSNRHPGSLGRGHRHPVERGDARTLLLLWIAGAIAGASIGGDWWSHYLIQLVAPLAIWLAWTLSDCWPGIGGSLRWVTAIVVIVLLLTPYRLILAGGPNDMARAMFPHPGYPAQNAVAAYLREHTEPGTTIYVAFDQASIYYLADRPPAYRHLYDQELRGIPSSYADLISIISGPNPPLYIVSTRQPGPFADESRAFWQVVGQHYENVDTIEGVPIYRYKGAAIDASG